MEGFRLGENILRYRNLKKLTQEDIAAQVGVTKAAVCKWEKGQSLPDITLLPKLAALLDVTIDALLGYEPMLQEEQIRHLCSRYARELETENFHTVFEEIKEAVKTYYNCYPFLNRLCTLMIGRYKCAGGETAQKAVLEEIRSWCEHIIRDCRETRPVQNALSVYNLTDFCMGHYEKVIETLSEYDSLIGMSNSNDLLLIRSYIRMEENEKADKYTRLLMDKSVLNLIECGTYSLHVKKKDRKVCEEILFKTDLLIETEELAQKHAYEVMQYNLMAAVYLADHGERERVLERLKCYIRIAERLLSASGEVTPDTYMKRIREWTDESEITADYEMQGLFESISASLSLPVFESYREEAELDLFVKRLLEAAEWRGWKWNAGSDSIQD